MGIHNFSDFLRRYAPRAKHLVPITDYSGQIFAIDTAILLAVVCYVAKNEVTKKKSFLKDPTRDLEDYEKKIPSILWREMTKILDPEGPDYVFVFDGHSPALKKKNEGKKRAELIEKNKERFSRNYQTYLQKIKAGVGIDEPLRKELRNSWIQSTPPPKMMYSLSKQMLEMIGIRWVQAPGEAEQFCAQLARQGVVDGVYTTDSDTLTFGAPMIARGIETEIGSDGTPTVCFEILSLERILNETGLNYEEYVDLCILLKCDYNILDAALKNKGKGTVTVYKLIQKYRRIHDLPSKSLDLDSYHYEDCREIFMDSTPVNQSRKEISPDYNAFFEMKSFISTQGWGRNLSTLEHFCLERTKDIQLDDQTQEESESGSDSSSESESSTSFRVNDSDSDSDFRDFLWSGSKKSLC